MILVSELMKQDGIKPVKLDQKQNENKTDYPGNEEKECHILFRKDLGYAYTYTYTPKGLALSISLLARNSALNFEFRGLVLNL